MSDKKVYLEFLYRNYTEAIRAADQKVFLLVSIALAVAVFVRDDIASVSALFKSAQALWIGGGNWQDTVHHISTVASLLATFLGILFGLSAMRPSSRTSGTDLIFWGNVARMKRRDFIASIDTALAQAEFAGLAENVYDLSLIVRRKNQIVSILVFLVMLMIFFTLLFIASGRGR